MSTNPNSITRMTCFADPPNDVKVTERKSGSIKLRVVPSSDLAGVEYKVQWLGEKDGKIYSEELLIDQLNPYNEVDFSVSSCFRDDAQVAFCGPSKPFKELSNVGGEFDHFYSSMVSLLRNFRKRLKAIKRHGQVKFCILSLDRRYPALQ